MLTFAIASQVSSFPEAMLLCSVCRRWRSRTENGVPHSLEGFYIKHADNVRSNSKVRGCATTHTLSSSSSSAPPNRHPRWTYYRGSPRREGKRENRVRSAKMSKLVRRVGNFFFDQAAKQYERSMTRKLNAFGERHAVTVAASCPSAHWLCRSNNTTRRTYVCPSRRRFWHRYLCLQDLCAPRSGFDSYVLCTVDVSLRVRGVRNTKPLGDQCWLLITNVAYTRSYTPPDSRPEA